MNPMNLPYKTCPPVHQTGLSLVELMIALAIGLVLLLGLSTLMVQQNSSRSEMEKSSRQIENGRYAIQLLHDDIQLAGFYGDYSPASGVAVTTTDPCLAAGNLGWTTTPLQVPVAIFGYAGAATDPTPTTCLDNYLADTAVLVIRRTSTTPIPVAAAVANTTYLQASQCSTDPTPFVLGTGGFGLHQKGCSETTAVCTPIDPATGLPDPNFGLGLSCLRSYIVRIYYVSGCSVCGSDTIPTLKMVEFVGGNQTIVPLVEGIENMQFDYGIDANNDGTPDNYATADLVASWPNVTAVQVNLLARNNDTTPGHADSKTYNLGGAGTVGTFGDDYKRHAYSQLVRVINPGGRRE